MLGARQIAVGTSIKVIFRQDTRTLAIGRSNFKAEHRPLAQTVICDNLHINGLTKNVEIVCTLKFKGTLSSAFGRSSDASRDSVNGGLVCLS